MKDLKENVMAWLMDEASDDEIIQVVSEVNSWDNGLEDYRFYYMDELDDIFYDTKPTELLKKLTDDFSVKDEGFKETMCGLESCSESDIADDIRHNANEVAAVIVEVLEHIDADRLKNYLEEIDLEDQE